MECQCEKDNSDAATGWWMSPQMGAFTVVGYLLYRFSQTLPSLIRWPIRLFCSLTGLSTLWSWVSRLVGTLRGRKYTYLISDPQVIKPKECVTCHRKSYANFSIYVSGIQSLCKWLSRIWGFVGTSSSKFKWLVAVITGSSGDGALGSERDPTSSANQPGLRLILLGPTGGGRTSLADTLLGGSEKTAPMGPLMESTKRRTVMGGREVIVIDTPDLLGPSMGNNKRAREALRSLQLSSPGPHAFLLVIPAGGSSTGINQDMAKAIRSTLELFGDGVATYIIPVLTHVDCLGRNHTIDQMLDADSEGLERALSRCNQRSELVDNGPDCPPEAKSVMRRQLVGRVTEMNGGHFVHELQRREDRIREELLTDMGSVLAGKLGGHK
ncbi:GTPase IMAP family member 4-like isoform X1 [Cyclopterus lumpus]|uniref:GTPase IMAP family member 4-like isoform X1 n=1 Tax=Cyclopterus lumpus TaxID=8103 RepID=UPI00148712D2|nr:GTPase IMAP family member 4-like isoform X1 [Cyclopterus lumpus]